MSYDDHAALAVTRPPRVPRQVRQPLVRINTMRSSARGRRLDWSDTKYRTMDNKRHVFRLG